MRQRILGSASGSALLPSLIAVVVLAGFSALVFTLSLSHSREVGRAGSELRALYVAEAGLGEALLVVAEAVEKAEAVPESHGTPEDPIELQGGSCWASIQDNGDDTYTVVATGLANGSARSIEGVLQHVGNSAFDHAVFAGNTSQDPDYTLRFGGKGTQGDRIEGNIFSAGDIEVTGDAAVKGDVLASGTITGVAGTENATRPLPDIAGMNYESNHDVNVAAAFASQGVWKSNSLGGSAFQLPETEPAHIFRKNPDNRLTEINGTPRDDFFLEDPYMPVTDFTAYNGKEGHTITLSGAPKRPGADGNGLVYFIDGDLWVHNRTFLRLRFLTQDSSGTRVTFIVKGNIHFSDDVLLQDPKKDAVAFIAIKDAEQADTGNIYFGDPRYGTLERMYGYMYAENDFHDVNLDATDSQVVEIFGNMTAGNHVAIQRDYLGKGGKVSHSKLAVHFDDRLSKKNVTLPGIPRVRAGVGGFRIAFWREVAQQ